VKIEDILQIPPDTLLAEDVASDDVVEMANLPTAQPGVPGTIFISTAMGGRGGKREEIGSPVSLWPGLTRPSTPSGARNKGVDARIKSAQDDFKWLLRVPNKLSLQRNFLGQPCAFAGMTF
jgi:hypothetical protein